MASHTTYIIQVQVLPMLDWMTRHDSFYDMHSRTREAIRTRMSPDELICGTLTGTKVDPHEVLVLKNKLKPVQLRLCVMWGCKCKCHPGKR